MESAPGIKPGPHTTAASMSSYLSLSSFLISSLRTFAWSKSLSPLSMEEKIRWMPKWSIFPEICAWKVRLLGLEEATYKWWTGGRGEGPLFSSGFCATQTICLKSNIGPNPGVTSNKDNYWFPGTFSLLIISETITFPIPVKFLIVKKKRNLQGVQKIVVVG